MENRSGRERLVHRALIQYRCGGSNRLAFSGGGPIVGREADSGVGSFAVCGLSLKIVKTLDSGTLLDDAVGHSKVFVYDFTNDSPAIGVAWPARLIFEIREDIFAVFFDSLDVAKECVTLRGEDCGGQLSGRWRYRGRWVKGV